MDTLVQLTKMALEGSIAETDPNATVPEENQPLTVEVTGKDKKKKDKKAFILNYIKSAGAKAGPGIPDGTGPWFMGGKGRGKGWRGQALGGKCVMDVEKKEKEEKPKKKKKKKKAQQFDIKDLGLERQPASQMTQSRFGGIPAKPKPKPYGYKKGWEILFRMLGLKD